ncbi:MAG: cysteine-rich KTR domain-containing protein [Lachnospiraceae bacterium]|nr:cysteine-rich KTR domain-containing protein [Lachnospiraceae bacterium]
MQREQWVLCPICQNKTRLKIREDTELKNFPLYCPKCRQEHLINVQQLNMTIIKEPDAEPITNENETRGCRLFFIGG